MAENFAGVVEQLKENKAAIEQGTEQTRVSLSNVNKNLAFRLQNIGKDFSDSVGLQENAIKLQQRMANEEERKALLGGGGDDTDVVEGKDLGTGTFLASFKGLKVLLGSVAVFFLGVLAVVKSLENPTFKAAVTDLFNAIGDVFKFLRDEVGPALFPIVTSILTFTVEGITAVFKGILKVFEYLKDFNDNADIDPEDYKGIAPIGALTVAGLSKIKAAITSISGSVGVVATSAEDAAAKVTTTADDVKKTRVSTFLTRMKTLFTSPFTKLATIFSVTFQPLIKIVDGFVDTFKGIFTSIRGGFMTTSSRFKQILKPINTLRTTLTNIMAPLLKLPGLTKIPQFFGKAGGFLKFLGKLFLPFTIIIGLVDTVKGFYAGFFGTDLEEGEEPPEGFINKLMAGLEGGVTGLINSLVGAPLDFLKGAVGWFLGKMGFTGAEEALATFSFKNLFADLLNIIFNPIDTIVGLFRRIFDFDILGWLSENVPGMKQIIDFFTTDEIEAEFQKIRSNRQLENQVSNLQKRIDDAQAKLDDPNFTGNREFQMEEIAKREAQIAAIRADTGFTVEGIGERIANLEMVAQSAEGSERNKLLERIQELEILQDELRQREAEKANINVTNVNDNKSTNVNQNSSTFSTSKAVTPLDPTQQYLVAAGLA